MLTSKEKLFAAVNTIHGTSKHNNLFRKLHYVFGFDYNKPFDSVLIEGRFTINNVKKAVNHDSTKTTVILICGTDFYKGVIRCVIVNNENGGFSIDVKERLCPWAVGQYQLSFDTYFRKADFDEDRKHNVQALVISQENKYLSGTGYPSTCDALSDNNERFKPGRVINGANMAGTIKYISQVEFSPVHSHGEKYNYQSHGRVMYSRDIEKYPKTILDVFDRSGYYVFERRENLKRAAAARRAENEKNVFIGSDYSAELAELETLKTKALETLKTKAAAAADHETLLELSRKIERFLGGLAWIIRDHELFIDRITGKKYSSCTKAAAAFEDVKSKYEKFITEWNF